jgi:hypothetical protein
MLEQLVKEIERQDNGLARLRDAIRFNLSSIESNMRVQRTPPPIYEFTLHHDFSDSEATSGQLLRDVFKDTPISRILELQTYGLQALGTPSPFVVAREAEERSTHIASRFASKLRSIARCNTIAVVLDREGGLSSKIRRLLSSDISAVRNVLVREIDTSDERLAGLLNPFDLDLAACDEFSREKLLGTVMDLQIQALENLVGTEIMRDKVRPVRHLLRLVNAISNSSLDTLLAVLRPDASERFAAVIGELKNPSSSNFYNKDFHDFDFRTFAEGFDAALTNVLKDQQLHRLTCRGTGSVQTDDLFRPGNVLLLDLSKSGRDAEGIHWLTTIYLTTMQLKRLRLTSKGQQVNFAVYVDDIAGCLGGSLNCDEILFRKMGTPDLELSLGMRGMNDLRSYSALAANLCRTVPCQHSRDRLS